MSSSANVNRYVILVKSAIVMLCAALLYSVSVFIKPLATLHGWSVQDTAMVGSTMLLFWPMGAFVGGKVLSVLGAKKTTIIGAGLFGGGMVLSAFVPSSTPWLIYVTYSALCGFGNGFAYTGATFTAGTWFPERKGFAVGVCMAVYGGSASFLAPMATKSILTIGVTATLIIFGAAAFIIAAICGLGLKTAPEGYLPEGAKIDKKNDEESKLESYSLSMAVKTKSFWAFTTASAFFPAVYLIMFPLFVVFMQDKGIGLAAATAGVSAFSLASLFGRFGLGVLQDKLGHKVVYTLCWFFVMLSVIFLITGTTAPVIIAAYAFLGIGFGATNPVYAFTSLKVFGPKYAGSIYGASLLGYMLFTQIVPRISNAIHNSTEGWTASFIFAGILCTLAMIFMWMMPKLKREPMVEIEIDSAKIK